MITRKSGSALRDFIRLCRCMTPRRLLNLTGLLFSWLIARYLKVIVVPEGPSGLSFEPGTACNLRCPECPSGNRSFTRQQGMADLNLFRSALAQMDNHLIWLNLYFQGEPFIHPRFAEMVAIGKKHRYYTMTSTNGHYLSVENCHHIIDAGLDRLVVSLDGWDQQSYSRYRQGGDVQKVKEGIETLCRIKNERKSSRPYLVIQCLLFRHNLDQTEEIKQLIRRKGIDEVTFKKAQFYNLSKENPLIPSDGTMTRYTPSGTGEYRIKSRLPDHCRRLWFSSVLTWDGMVLPCCYDKDADHRMGDAGSEPFSKIWGGKAYNDFRRRVFFFRKTIPVCTNCGEGLD
jgi:MoaA/NifB/PqqE/SkfB family radical SAM enzyme